MRKDLSHRGLLLFVLLFVVSCGGGGDDSVVDPDTNFTTMTISLSASTATTAGRIAITGIPGDVGDVYAVVSFAGADSVATGTAIIDRQAAGDSLIVPIHPATAMAGGLVELQVTDGIDLHSNTVTLMIDPLPAAPGAFADLITATEELFDTWLVLDGITRQELHDTPVEELSFFNIPSLFVYNLLDRPDNPNSLRALADGDIPDFDDGVPFDRDLLDSIVAISGLRGMVADKQAFFDGLTPPVIPGPASAKAWPGSTPAAGDCIQAPRFDIGPDDCALLAEIMSYQSSLELKAASAVQKYKNDLINAGLSLMGSGRAAKVAAGITSSLWAVATIEEGHSELYPSEFIQGETDYKMDTETFNEDFTSPGRWSEFKVGAVSRGWNFEQKAAEALEMMISAAPGPDVPGETTPKNIREQFREKYEGQVKNRFTNDAKAGLIADDAVELKYCAQEWHAIDCTKLPHSSASSTSLKYDSAQLTYEPSKVGIEYLKVETEAGMFGAGRGTGVTKPVETRRLEVSIDPFSVLKETSEGQQFHSAVLNGESDLVEWKVEWTDLSNVGTFSPAGGNATIVTPPDPWAGSILVKARSRSNTGLRAGKVDSDPREDESEVIWAGARSIIITPADICIPLGKPQKFEAFVPGMTNQAVTWSASVGSFTGDVYSTPNSPVGEVTITATSVEDPNVTGSVTVEVSDCSCYWTLNVTGDVTGTWSGEFILWSDQFFTSFRGDDGLGGFPGFAFGIEEVISGPGGYVDAGGANIGFGPSDIYLAGEDPENGLTLPTIFIMSIDSETVEGRVTGRLCKPITVEPYCSYIDFDLEFRAKHDTRGDGCQ